MTDSLWMLMALLSVNRLKLLVENRLVGRAAQGLVNESCRRLM